MTLAAHPWVILHLSATVAAGREAFLSLDRIEATRSVPELENAAKARRWVFRPLEIRSTVSSNIERMDFQHGVILASLCIGGQEQVQEQFGGPVYLQAVPRGLSCEAGPISSIRLAVKNSNLSGQAEVFVTLAGTAHRPSRRR